MIIVNFITIIITIIVCFIIRWGGCVREGNPRYGKSSIKGKPLVKVTLYEGKSLIQGNPL